MMNQDSKRHWQGWWSSNEKSRFPVAMDSGGISLKDELDPIGVKKSGVFSHYGAQGNNMENVDISYRHRIVLLTL